MTKNRYIWYRAGDVNAFFGLMLDNIAGMVLLVTLLHAVFKFPVDFALQYMIPGTAIGVLVGDMLYFWLALRLAKKEGRSDVTAMPLGLDTPSTFGMVFLVLGPAFSIKMATLADNAGWALDELRNQAASGANGPIQILEQMNLEAATFAWHIGICSIFISGLIKFVLSFGCNWLRVVFPRAGLLGSLAAIALVLIAFSPLEKISANPIVGFAALIIVFVTLLGRNQLPFKIPGALAAVVVGCVVWYALLGLDAAGFDIVANSTESASPIHWLPTEWLTVFSFGWMGEFRESLAYLPYIIPFAIATVIGGIDCAESAASCGDDFDTNSVIRIEAFSTLIASLCGGVIQSTPYIGHPAYKAMGGRAAYVLATALFVGGAGLIGYFGLIFRFIPEAAVLPILIFIGIEITAQSFHVTPRRHYAAIAVACLPAIAKLVVLAIKRFAPMDVFASNPEILVLKVLAGGFIITSLLWASAMAKIIDRRFISASIFMAVAGILVLFGVIHSPVDDQMFWPWQIMSFDEAIRKSILEFSAAYLVMAVILFGLGSWMKGKVEPINTDAEFEKLDHQV